MKGLCTSDFKISCSIFTLLRRGGLNFRRDERLRRRHEGTVLNPATKPLLEVLTSGSAYLQKKGIDEARLNMEHLLAHVLHCRRLDIYLRFGEHLAEPQLGVLRDLLRRRGEGEPLQHLLGTVEFAGREFVSDHRALIPRPETEYLVELVEKRLAAAPPARVLDMGTGSGCIGISLAHAFGRPTVLADISEDALDLARLNVSRLAGSLPVQTVRSDLFEKISGEFDLIVANLPYIPRAEIATLAPEVRRDPHLALDGGPVGTEVVFRFLEAAPSHLARNALVALEVGHDQGVATADKAASLGYTACEVVPDLAGVPRFVFARAPEKAAPPDQKDASQS
ncbi:MAG: peptide chain release factor N(5)-glutamine methyltransferase [Verrucomicrobiaceae bacterium]|nr:peptide chain release factor N(5)-glutamine methyltransferase [Verrucomicrobiaceae bacterium]